MQNPSLTLLKNRCCKAEEDPVLKIRSLIKNLDLELVTLCNQIPKYKPDSTQKAKDRRPSRYNFKTPNPSSLSNRTITKVKDINNSLNKNGTKSLCSCSQRSKSTSLNKNLLKNSRSSSNQSRSNQSTLQNRSSHKFNRNRLRKSSSLNSAAMNLLTTDWKCKPRNTSETNTTNSRNRFISNQNFNLHRSSSQSSRSYNFRLSKNSVSTNTNTNTNPNTNTNAAAATKTVTNASNKINITNTNGSTNKLVKKDANQTLTQTLNKILKNSSFKYNQIIRKYYNDRIKGKQYHRKTSIRAQEIKHNFPNKRNRIVNNALLRLKGGSSTVKTSNQSINKVHLVKVDSSKHSLNKNRNIVNPNSMLTFSPDSATAVQTKTLASIYRARVIDAYRNRKIFTVFGNYGTIRRALLKRGWLEKLAPNRYSRLRMLTEDVLLQHAKRGNDYETVAISKIINHFPAFFIWQPKAQRDLYGDVHPYRNRIRRAHGMDFCTKVGLIGCAEQQQWHRQEGVSDMRYPRFFRLGGCQEEQLAFIDEFRMTQCRSLLRYLLHSSTNLEELVNGDFGTVSSMTVHFAITKVRKQIEDEENAVSLDGDKLTVSDTDWSNFIEDSRQLITNVAKLKCSYRDLTELVKQAKTLMHKLDDIRPDYKWDGCRNLWILKPGYQCRGLGIIIRNNLDDILSWANTHQSRRYIVQKYIEQPLLIYRTKFDIRQYMILYIRESTVQIWLYRDCYLRFSSQEYNVEDLREVIHLTNNSVQKKYKSKITRDPRLPKNNMWSLDQFKSYINQKNLPDNIWENRVYTGFKKNLIAVVLASLDETLLIENSFELYGCDFMLDEQYNPILIEINSTPDLSPSTDITARICPMALQDLIKVVVDLPRNSRASTGLYELIYEVNYKFKQDYSLKEGLAISGKSMELRKHSRISVPSKLFRKVKKTEATPKHTIKTISSKTRSKSIQNATISKTSNKSATSRVGNRFLKSAAKEALALRYTMPK